MSDPTKTARQELADRAEMKAGGCRKQAEQFHALYGFTRRVGVQGRQRATVSGVQKLKKIEDLSPSALTQDDSIRSHSKRLLEKISQAYFAEPV